MLGRWSRATTAKTPDQSSREVRHGGTRGARGDAFRTGLPRLVQETFARSGSRKAPVNAAALVGGTSSRGVVSGEFEAHLAVSRRTYGSPASRAVEVFCSSVPPGG